MTDRVLLMLTLLGFGAIGAASVIVLDIYQPAIDRGLLTIVIGFLTALAGQAVTTLATKQNAAAIGNLPTKQDVKQAASEAVETAKTDTASALAEARNNPFTMQEQRRQRGM